MVQRLHDVGECVDATLRRVGPRIVLAAPLGIGKPVPLVNEFWRRALKDPALDLTIITALSLQRPKGSSELERRLVEPLVQRVFGNYEEPLYCRALREGTVPANIRVIEFFLEPGASLQAMASQQNYLSANYTHVARDIMARGVNVIAQLVAVRGSGAEARVSLSSNPDVTLDLLPLLAQRRADGAQIVLIAQAHSELPYMAGSAELPATEFDYLVDDPRVEHRLFCPPNPALSTVDHAIGLHASCLIRDGGTLQIGIGELGDSLCYALLLRHQQTSAYRQALIDIGAERSAALIEQDGGRDAFRTGLFASTEMFVDQLLDLWRAGVLRRRVYDSLPLAQLIARGNLEDRFDARILEDLLHVGVGPVLSESEFEALQEFGVFKRDCRYEDGRIRAPDGRWLDARLDTDTARRGLAASCLGRELRNGHVLHAGFFVGPAAFYSRLSELSDAERAQFDMRGVGYVNQLYGDDYDLRVLQRAAMRCVNTTMMVTLLGAAVSDALADGRVVSGVGGQYNFVAMAHALPDARSILCVRATRSAHGALTSNLIWNYGHTTIPRHLRDVVITEYGSADLRGRTDAECIAALLSICDSRFQAALLEQAKGAGKIARDHQIPALHRNNLPQSLERALSSHRRAGLFSEYPFGTDLTDEEVTLSHALRFLKERTATPTLRLRTVASALLRRASTRELPLLRRMGLLQPASRSEWLQRQLVILALQQGVRA